MKRNLLYTLALATFLVACDDDNYKDWADPQHNDPEKAQNVTFSAASVAAVNLADVTGDSVEIFTPSIQTEEGATVTYKVTLNEKETLEADNNGFVTVEALNNAIANLYGKRPTERTLSGVVNAYVNINDQVVRVSDSIEVKATLVAPVIETEYYFIGTTNDWTALDKSLKFSHSNEDVYDDPVFTLVVAAPIDATTGERVDQWFKIAPKSAYDGDATHFWASLLGGEINGDESLKASLKMNGESFKQPATDGAKFYSITLNMMDYTIVITPLAFDEFIYIPGNHQSWDPVTAPALQSPNFDGIYSGYSYLDGDFKFTKARDWSAEYNWNDFSEVSDLLTQGGGSNINMPTPGFYQITANIQTSSLNVVATTWGIIGDATPSGWDADTPMTYNSSDESWSVTANLTAGKFKFRANGEWAINYGGQIDNLSLGGDDISIEEDGNYTIKLYLTRNNSTNIYCTITKN